MKIYTRTGDRGETDLLAGGRIAKDAARLEAYATVDELNAVLGLVRAESPPEDLDRLLEQLQHHLLAAGAELAALDRKALLCQPISSADVNALEQTIDRYQDELTPLEQFIVPGGTRAAAALHLARTVCRRAERRLVTLARGGEPPVSAELSAFLNRLSDLLFVLARVANARAGRDDVTWRKTPRRDDSTAQ